MAKLVDTSAQLIHPYYFSWQKRFFDVFFAGCGLVLGLPLFFLISLAIWISAGRPVLYIQRRIGLHKQPFWMIKFRTMYIGADKDQRQFQKYNQAPSPMFKLFDDPRFVGVGHFLSAVGLDELPQLWNVLRGEMSLVGPRPLPEKQAAALGQAWQFRFLVKPGIFSEWTIAPDRHSSEKRWVEYERETVKKGSVLSDLGMIWRTLFRKNHH